MIDRVAKFSGECKLLVVELNDFVNPSSAMLRNAVCTDGYP